MIGIIFMPDKHNDVDYSLQLYKLSSDLLRHVHNEKETVVHQTPHQNSRIVLHPIRYSDNTPAYSQ